MENICFVLILVMTAIAVGELIGFTIVIRKLREQHKEEIKTLNGFLTDLRKTVSDLQNPKLPEPTTRTIIAIIVIINNATDKEITITSANGWGLNWAWSEKKDRPLQLCIQQH